ELDWSSCVFARKLEVAHGILRSEVRRIAREIRAAEPTGADTVPEAELEEAVAHVLAAFGVYRSYLPEGREHLDEALERARISTQHLESSAMDVVAQVLADPEHPAALRFQQTSGMVMAKGVED